MAYKFHMLGLPFGGPYNGRSASGIYFSARTDFWLDTFMPLGVIRNHGLDELVPMKLGQVQRATLDSHGVWFDVLTQENAETERMYQMAQRGNLFCSSGALSHLVRQAPDGHVLIWPTCELSLLDGFEPANPYAVVEARQSKERVNECGYGMKHKAAWNGSVMATRPGLLTWH